jgi:hypothetical protein
MWDALEQTPKSSYESQKIAGVHIRANIITEVSVEAALTLETEK